MGNEGLANVPIPAFFLRSRQMPMDVVLRITTPDSTEEIDLAVSKIDISLAERYPLVRPKLHDLHR